MNLYNALNKVMLEIENELEDNAIDYDKIANLMFNPNKNFDKIRYLFKNDKKLRVINTPLLSDDDHLELD